MAKKKQIKKEAVIETPKAKVFNFPETIALYNYDGKNEANLVLSKTAHDKGVYSIVAQKNYSIYYNKETHDIVSIEFDNGPKFPLDFKIDNKYILRNIEPGFLIINIDE